MNILIVEDSRFLRMSNERALSRPGYQVITAADGEEGLRLAQERQTRSRHARSHAAQASGARGPPCPP